MTRYWIADCPRCGQVSAKQESKPTICRKELWKHWAANSHRPVRRCGSTLTNQQDLTCQVTERE